MTQETDTLVVPQGGTLIRPDVLRPNLKEMPSSVVSRTYAYWLGLLPECPRNQIDCAGFSFQKMNEEIKPNPRKPGSKLRNPVPGGLHKHVNVGQIIALRLILPRLMLRFTGEVDSRMTTDDPDSPRPLRVGKLLKIPTPRQVAEAKARSGYVPHYEPEPEDEPAMNYMFFKLCEDQDRPRRGLTAPEPISVTGVWWPEPINQMEELLG